MIFIAFVYLFVSKIAEAVVGEFWWFLGKSVAWYGMVW